MAALGMTRRALLGSSLLWTGAAVAGQVCKPTDCFDGKCAGTPVLFENIQLPAVNWNGASYTPAGQVTAYKVIEDDFGIFLHGPLFRPAQMQPEDFAPPLYVSASLADKIFRFDGFRASPSNGGLSVSANMKFVSWAAGPSTMFPIPPSYEGGPERFLIAEGNPFIVNPGNHTTDMWMGGVDLVDQDKCTTIFPTDAVTRAIGKVVNTVDCHPSGFCFFSVWKFYDDSLPMTKDDCMWWCQTSAANDPTSCTSAGVVVDELGNKICHVDGKGAVHGLKVGKTDPNNSNAFDLFLMFTGKGTFDRGDSSIHKLRMEVQHGKNGAGSVRTVSSVAWGTDLWQKTVQAPHDVGVDHAWIDDDGNHVWIGTFRQQNDGVHMLEYDSGKLIMSIQGISTVTPRYSYTSGVVGIGKWGQKGSLLAVATCEQFGTQIVGGKSALVLIDISGFANSTSTPTTLVV